MNWALGMERGWGERRITFSPISPSPHLPISPSPHLPISLIWPSPSSPHSLLPTSSDRQTNRKSRPLISDATSCDTALVGLDDALGDR